MIYDKGDLVRCSAEFRDPLDDDALVDPATVRFKFETPAGVETTYVYGTDAQLVKESTGVYYVELNANAAGRWTYRFESTGGFQTAGEESFTVRASVFA